MVWFWAVGLYYINLKAQAVAGIEMMIINKNKSWHKIFLKINIFNHYMKSLMVKYFILFKALYHGFPTYNSQWTDARRSMRPWNLGQCYKFRSIHDFFLDFFSSTVFNMVTVFNNDYYGHYFLCSLHFPR